MVHAVEFEIRLSLQHDIISYCRLRPDFECLRSQRHVVSHCRYHIILRCPPSVGLHSLPREFGRPFRRERLQGRVRSRLRGWIFADYNRCSLRGVCVPVRSTGMGAPSGGGVYARGIYNAGDTAVAD